MAIDIEKAAAAEENTIWPILAVLRFVLAMDVLILHTHLYTLLPWPLKLIPIPGGGAAVLAFLVVSGYSIAHSITKESKGFYARRIDRIYPMYAVAMALGVIALLTVAPPDKPITLAQWIGTPLFLNGFFVPRVMIIGTAWLLCIEVLFYALAPLFVKLPTKALLAISAVSAVYFILLGGSNVAPFCNHGTGALMLAWPWLLGFVYYRHKCESWAKAMIIALPAFVSGRNDEEFSTSIVALSCTWIVFAPPVSPKAAKVFLYLGELSYPIYILHMPILQMLNHGGTVTNLPWVLLICLPVAAAILAYHLVDRPYRNYAKRVYARRTASPGEPQAEYTPARP